MLRSEIIREAKSWIGTPFVHQASLKGVGADCYGLVRGVAAYFGVQHEPLLDYARIPDGRMMSILRAELEQVERACIAPGDIVAIAWHRQWQHLGIYNFEKGRHSLIHAYGSDRRGGVVETSLGITHSRRIRGVFQLPGVQDG